MTAYRDEHDAVRARIESLEAELAAAIHELHNGVCNDPTHLDLERRDHILSERLAARSLETPAERAANAQLATTLEQLRAELHDLEAAREGIEPLAARLDARNDDSARLQAVRHAVALVPRKQAALAKLPKPVIVLRRRETVGRLAFPFTLGALGVVAEGIGAALFGVPGLLVASVFGLGTAAYAAYSEQRRRHVRQIASGEVFTRGASRADTDEQEPLFARAGALELKLAEIRELIARIRSHADRATCTYSAHAVLRERVERLDMELGTAPHPGDRHPETFRRRVLERAIETTRNQIAASRPQSVRSARIVEALQEARRRQRALDPYRPRTALAKRDADAIRTWPRRRVIEPGLVGIVLASAVMLMPAVVFVPMFVVVGLATAVTLFFTHWISDAVLQRKRRDPDLLSSEAVFGMPWTSVDSIAFDARGFTLGAGSKRHRIAASGDYARACELVLDAASEHDIVVRGAPPLALPAGRDDEPPKS